MTSPRYQTEETRLCLPDIISALPLTVRVSPHYAKAAQASEAWFGDHNIYVGRALERFFRCKLTLCVAMSYPDADEVALRNMSDCAMWLSAFDDLTDKGDLQNNAQGAQEAADRMMDALMRPHVKCEDPIAELLRDFWQRIAKTAAAGCQRFAFYTMALSG